jgi:hypothetical protein
MIVQSTSSESFLGVIAIHSSSTVFRRCQAPRRIQSQRCKSSVESLRRVKISSQNVFVVMEEILTWKIYDF